MLTLQDRVQNLEESMKTLIAVQQDVITEIQKLVKAIDNTVSKGGEHSE